MQYFVDQNTTSEQIPSCRSDHSLDANDSSIQSSTMPEKHSELGNLVGKVAAGIALVGYFTHSTEQEAMAFTTEAIANQGQGQESSAPTIIAAAAVAGTFLAILRQRKDSKENRFADALKGIQGETSGEQRLLSLAALRPYAKRKEFAPTVFIAVSSYLLGRRSALDVMRREFGEGTPEFEEAVRERRYADREAFHLILTTLGVARKELRESTPSRIKQLLGADDIYNVKKLTDSPIPKHKPRVPAHGLNLDYLRDIYACSFRDIDLRGAGLQGNQFSNVVFKNGCLSEAQFEGSTLNRCDLRKTDARGAYWYGATIEHCVIDKHTKLGNLPDEDLKAKFGRLDPDRADEYRGMPQVVLKNLKPRGMTQKAMEELIHEWQRNGLVLLPGSNKEYFLPANELKKVKSAGNLGATPNLEATLGHTFLG